METHQKMTADLHLRPRRSYQSGTMPRSSARLGVVEDCGAYGKLTTGSFLDALSIPVERLGFRKHG